MSAHQKPAPQNSARPGAAHAGPDPDFYRSHDPGVVSVRRKLCSHLLFWKFCGHKPCRRAQSCAHPANQCFGLFWPVVPDWVKQGLHAGVKAKAAGLPAAEIDAAVARAIARCNEAQALPAAQSSAPQTAQVAEVAPAPPPRVAAPARAIPRARVL